MNSHPQLWLGRLFLLLLCSLPGLQAAELFVTGGGAALQTAINSAATGDTVTINDSLTYNPVSVSKRLTIRAAATRTPRVLANPSVNSGIGLHVFNAGREGSW